LHAPVLKLPHKTLTGGKLRSLQAGRGVAAFGVLISHAVAQTSFFVAPVPNWLTTIANQGVLGVDFFFVLSGFIILNAHIDDPQTLKAARTYAFKRITRIYIPYLPISLFLIADYLLIGNLSQADRDWGWLTSLLLVPSSHPPVLPVAWTLVHEMLFYTVFLLYFLNRQIFAVAVLGWAVAMLVQPPISGTAVTPLTTTLLNPINLEFCFGLVCALGYRVINVRYGGGLIFIGLGVIVFFLVKLGQDARVVFGFGTALIILGVTLQEKKWGSLIPTALVSLGDASYPIYLLHMPLIALTARVAAQIPFLHNWVGGLSFSLCCVIAAGLGYRHFYERPALTAIRDAGHKRQDRLRRWAHSE
jgi:exopolysaccharide production protein ExoZ